MPFKFNPFTGNFDQTGSGGGGASYIDGEVQNFSALPQTVGSPAVDSAYLVREAEGTWLLNRKPAGIYIRTANTGTRASDWTYAGEFPDVFNDANFVLYDSADSTKNLQFQLSGIDTATTRTLTAPNASGRIQVEGQPIGNTTPSTGAFTTLTANTSLTLGTSGILSGGTNTIEQRNTTSGQTFRIYNTVSGTADANFERGFMRWSSNVLQIGTEKAGTGSARNLELVVDGTTRMIIDTSGQIGIGNGVSLNRPFHIYGTTAWGRIDRVGTVGPAWLMVRMSTGQTVASSWLFGPLCGAGSTVAGVTDDDFAISDFGTSISGTAGTARLTISKSTGQLTVNGNLNLSTKDLVTDTTTGTKIGTGTTQKIGFFNATPVVQQAAIADATDAATTQARLNDLLATMRTFGLIAT